MADRAREVEDDAAPWRHRRGHANALAYLGLNYTTAVNGVILNSFIPVMIIALSWLFLRERLSGVQLAGVAVSLGGVLVILSRGSLEQLASFRLNAGDVLVILSMAMWSTYTICLRWRPAGLHVLTFLFVLIVVGDLCVLPFFLGELALGHRMVSFRNLTAIALVAVFSSVLAYLFWNRGVEQVGANVAGLFVHLMPLWRRPRMAGAGRRARAVPCCRDCAYPDGHLDHEPARAPSRAGAGGARGMMTTDIGDADRVAMMQRLAELKLEHRDLDDMCRRLDDDPSHDRPPDSHG